MTNKKQPISPPFDLSNIKYCEIHESHWISKEGVEENCPWCQRDKLEDYMVQFELIPLKHK